MENKITSKENNKIKHVNKLLNSTKFRAETESFVIEGVKMCTEAVLASENKYGKFMLKQVFYTEACFKKFGNKIQKIISLAKENYLISENILKNISDTNSPQGIVCVCSVINDVNKIVLGDKIVILAEIQNPSNLGSILRICDAFGANNVILSQNSCDVYNPKVLRGSMGAVFRLNVFKVENLTKMIFDLKAQNFKIYASVLHQKAISILKADFNGKIGLVLGNEGNGISREVTEACDEKIFIPMCPGAESLNVSAAAAVAIWEITNRGKFSK